MDLSPQQKLWCESALCWTLLHDDKIRLDQTRRWWTCRHLRAVTLCDSLVTYLIYSTTHLTLTSLSSVYPTSFPFTQLCLWRCHCFAVIPMLFCLLVLRFFFVFFLRAGTSVEVGFGFCQLPLSSHCTFRWTPHPRTPHRKQHRRWIEQTHTWSPFTSTDRLAETEHYSARWQIDSERWGDGALKSIRAIFMTVNVYIYIYLYILLPLVWRVRLLRFTVGGPE